ncbi:MAG: exo-alpha-sialidase [Myxococcales bacterium]|nr:exo-alpha-sialidase [Myxococcales bacterium]
MSDRLLVATRKGLFVAARGGAGWRIDSAAMVGDPVSFAMHDRRDGAVHAALNLGHFGVKMMRSDDGGKSFEEQATPAYPEKPDGLDDRDEQGRETPWSVQQIWALAAGNADQPGLLWCGTIPGGLFRSDDGGKRWALVRSLWELPERKQWFGGGYDWPGIHSICVDPRDGKRVSVAVSCGGVWKSDDLGETWRVSTKGMIARFMPPERQEDPVIQDPHLMARCPSAPDTLWVQHHNGIFRSDDDAATWRELTWPGDAPPSTFGFAVAVHPDNADVAWFVPAESDQRRMPAAGAVTVVRTRDGGKSCEVLREGLPQQHAYDLVYRHALDVDDSGERLALGSTTGALWVSDDGGDSFATVSAHLPPIYSVRFF